MTQQHEDDEARQLENALREILSAFSLEPNPTEVRQLDQELPREWTQLEPEREFAPDQLQQFLDAPLDLPPEQEIDRLAQEATQELDLDELFKVDLPERTQERAPDLDLDFDR